MRRVAAAVALTALTALLGGCASASEAAERDTLRLGYFANVTHGVALVGVHEGIFADALGETQLQTEVFTAGPAAVEALAAGAVDAVYLGPAPAANTFVRGEGRSGVIVAGAATGGAALVARAGVTIDGPEDLVGLQTATPGLGNTQDVALRSWLRDADVTTTRTGRGDAAVTPTANATVLSLMERGEVDAAWTAEPWVSRLVAEAGAHVVLDEGELWPDGRYPTTVLMVSADLEQHHPERVSALLEGHLRALDTISADRAAAASIINDQLEIDAGAGLDDAVLANALENVDFTADPVAAAFETIHEDAVAAGLQQPGDLAGLVDLSELNRQLEALGRDAVSDAGLGGTDAHEGGAR